MSDKGIVNRTLTPAEFHWLHKVVKKGTVVYRYRDCTYGAISTTGVAVTLKPDQTPFFEVPGTAVDWK